MKKTFLITACFTAIGLSLVFAYNHFSHPTIIMTPETEKKLSNTIYLELKDGRVIIEMLPDIAPMHVQQIKKLVRGKFYDNLTFHRVIDGFMVQGGDPKGDGTGGAGKTIPSEFSTLSHKRGAVSMARSQDPNSASSQFFIVTQDSLFLDGQYTIWGCVISGMEHVDKIKQGDMKKNGMVTNPDKIVSMKIALDVEKEKIHNNAEN